LADISPPTTITTTKQAKLENRNLLNIERLRELKRITTFRFPFDNARAARWPSA